MEFFAFRFFGQKRSLVGALVPAAGHLHNKAVSGLRFKDFPETAGRAAEAVNTSRSRWRSVLVNALRRRLFGWQYNFWRRHFAARPDAIALAWNGLVSSRRVFMQAARDAGARTLYLERGPLPQTLTADPVGVNFHNGLPRDAGPYLAWLHRHPEADAAWRPVAETLRQRPATAQHEAGLRPPPPLDSPFVFLPLQKQGDTQLRFFGRACTGVRETVEFVAAAARELPPGWHIRLKQHPSDKARFSGLLDAHADLPLYLDNATDTFTQVRASRLVLTVNSSVGLEAMLLGVRVAVMGEAFWAIPGAVADAGSSAALQELLANPEATMPDLSVRNALLSFLVAEYYPRLVRDAQGRVSLMPADLEKLHRRIAAGYVLAKDGSTP
jgi:capsular polysaccharide export protein